MLQYDKNPAPAALDAAEREVARVFPGLIFASLTAASNAVGISAKTYRNLLSAGAAVPFASLRIGGKRVVPVAALVKFLATKLEEAGCVREIEPPQPPARRGRPRKVAAVGVAA